MVQAAHYSAVVVGSGFGGSVMAYRLAEAGLRVCVLERGKAYPPGSFPRTPYQMRSNFWDPSEGLYGLFHIWSFREIAAITASGLGGGSLIYANALIRKPPEWFIKEDLSSGGYEFWPIQYEDLEPHYDQVEEWLGATPYPFEHQPYDQSLKTKALESVVTQFPEQLREQLQLKWYLPNLAITFGNNREKPIPGEPIQEEYPNLHGQEAVRRYTCRLCGECYIGCNYGSKNTLDFNLLSEAKRFKAEIKTLCQVRSFEPQESGGYAVHYTQRDPNDERKKTDLTITSDQLILAAGTFGSTYLLLKMKREYPNKFQHLSKKLGTRFCGNGDLISLATRCRQKKNGIEEPRIINSNYGPSITGAIRIRDRSEGGQGRGFYIEDVGYPDLVSWLVLALDSPSILRRWLITFKRLIRGRFRGSLETDLSAEIADLLGNPPTSATVLPLLGIGHDVPNGEMQLRGDRLDLLWPKKDSRLYFERVRDTMKMIAEDALGGVFRQNPLRLSGRLVTGHPLGGCPMGRNEHEGIVNSWGEVFNYPGLYVADGSVMPGPVGANPSLTIAAFANRVADQVIHNCNNKHS